MSLLRRIEGGKPPEPPNNDNAEENSIDLGPLTARLRTELFAKLDPASRDDPPPETRGSIEEMIRTLLNTLLAQDSIELKPREKYRLIQPILAELFGFGPLEVLWEDESITEIMVNNHKTIYIVRTGRRQHANVSFENEDHVMKILNRIFRPMGIHLDEVNPIARAKLPDGSQIHAIIRPVAMNGPTITMRKFSKVLLTVEMMLRLGTLTVDAAEFLRACVIARLNIVVVGSDGKQPGITSLLNVLANFIPDDERIIAIESVGELHLHQEQVITLVPRHPDLQGQHGVTMRKLVQNVRYMAPDRLVLDECQHGEVLDLLELMASGYDGTLVAFHNDGSRGALASLEAMCQTANPDLSARAIQDLIASAIQLIVHVERMRDGSRKVMAISEVQDGETLSLSHIFKFEEQSERKSQQVVGRLQPTGIHPNAATRIADVGIHLPLSLFDPDARDAGEMDRPSQT